ncbi:MAG TPA: zinc ribbon domain-containing protein [Candidatus Elarobacter sp.]|jgi:hypothetical protein|nr:zinc ribbon domain-containing protein [Candidatus Elarobacter sp.]
MVFCSNCGKHADGRFCYACGSPLHVDNQPVASVAAQEPLVIQPAFAAAPSGAPVAAAVADRANPAVADRPVPPADWRAETKEAWRWWLRGFVWLTAIVSLEMIVMLSNAGAAAGWTPAEAIASWMGGFLGLGLVLLIQYALARWLLSSFERGSGVARRVYQIGFVALGLIRTVFGLVMLGSLIPLLDTLAGVGQLAAWGYSAWLLQRVNHKHTPHTVVREDGTVVRMRTEIPSFVATVAILVLGVVQLSADLLRSH